MKNTFFAFIIISIFSTGIVSAQNTVVAAAQKLPANPVSANIEPPKGYMLGPGDEISGSVLLEPQFNFIATVNEDGRIEVPFFETPIMAKCKTEKELRTDITALLSKYLRNPQLSLRTEKKSRPKTTVYGEVRNPAQIELTRRATLIELIAAAGGITEDAGGVIQVFRTQPPLCSDASDENNWKAETGDATEVPSRIYSLAAVRLGREESNPVILPECPARGAPGARSCLRKRGRCRGRSCRSSRCHPLRASSRARCPARHGTEGSAGRLR